jgi:hypothetical protein
MHDKTTISARVGFLKEFLRAEPEENPLHPEIRQEE